MAGIELGGAGQEPGAGGTFLVGKDLGISQPGVVIDGGMDIIETSAAEASAMVVIDQWSLNPPTATVRDPAEFLHVNVDEVARCSAFITQLSSTRSTQLDSRHWVELE